MDTVLNEQTPLPEKQGGQNMSIVSGLEKILVGKQDDVLHEFLHCICFLGFQVAFCDADIKVRQKEGEDGLGES